MNSLALLLILASAVAHATWNVFAKRTRGGAVCIWLYDTLSALLYLPLIVLLVVVQPPSLSLIALLFMLGSAFLHLLYFLCLQRGYRLGDLSLVYPLARGTGPLCSSLLAILLLGEHPTLLALAGLILVVIGIFTVTGGTQVVRHHIPAPVLLYGVLTGLLTAGYTVWDKEAVSILLVPVVLFFYSATLSRGLLLTPYALCHWDHVQRAWNTARRESLVIAILSPLSYVLFLLALVFTPVSYAAPTREVGVLFGTLMGAHLLKEGHARRRILGACLIFVGIVALAL